MAAAIHSMRCDKGLKLHTNVIVEGGSGLSYIAVPFEMVSNNKQQAAEENITSILLCCFKW
jgi:hypothetical protein